MATSAEQQKGESDESPAEHKKGDIEPLIEPKNLKEWRSVHVCEGARKLWNGFEPFFLAHGYRLFEGTGSLQEGGNIRLPAELSARSAPDGTYAFDLVRWPYAVQPTSLHCWARNRFNQDVIIKVIAWNEEGKHELEILRRIASGVKAFHPDNHALYVTHELSFENKIFCVFPRMEDNIMRPEIWFYDFGELFEFLVQIVEGFRFLHDNLIAHRDIGYSNFLINFSGRTEKPWLEPKTLEELAPFRSSFPVRYFIIDFELSAMFSKESDPATRLVTGIPTVARGFIHPEDYGRDLPPESVSDKPHCPFKADVYQLGAILTDSFEHLYEDIPQLSPLFTSMTDENPLLRPDIVDIKRQLKSIRESSIRQFLSTRVPIAPEKPYIDPVEDHRQRQERKMQRLAAPTSPSESNL